MTTDVTVPKLLNSYAQNQISLFSYFQFSYCLSPYIFIGSLLFIQNNGDLVLMVTSFKNEG